MITTNKGFDLAELKNLRDKMAKSGNTYVTVDSEDNSDDFQNFLFIGKYENRDVIYDAAIYTLKVQHHSEVYEMAEHEAAIKFPNYKKIDYEEDENGDIEPLEELEEEMGLFMAEVMEEIEDEERVKVKEHIDIDINSDFGIGLDVGLNIEVVEESVINDFIIKFNNDEVKLDPTMYSFQLDHDTE
jgi:hypothetical protein